MNKRILIVISLILHGVIFISSALTINSTPPIFIVKETNSSTEKENAPQIDLEEFLSELNYVPAPTQEKEKRPLRGISTFHIKDKFYAVEYDFVVMVLIMTSAAFHIYTFRQPKLQTGDGGNG